MQHKYKWRRYWSPPDAQISLSDGGFLHDPMDGFGKYVNSSLIAIDVNNLTNCLVLLGEPGIGKSIEIRGLFDSTLDVKGADKVSWLDLRDFMTPEHFIEELESHSGYQEWVKGTSSFYLFLDSFDEGVFSFPHFAKAFEHLLTRHKSRIEDLFLRISCRTAVWPSYFEDGLRVLWDVEGFNKYELCPLIKEDVITALTSRGLDAQKFALEVSEKNVAGLAGKPLTLNMLIDVFERGGCLPSRKVEIYMQGCSLLLQEPDASKNTNPSTKPKLDLVQRLAIAERIAASTVISGKSAVLLNETSTANDGELKLIELQGNEIVDDTLIRTGEDQVKEVLNTGLFSSRGDGKMGWAHQTYGEFLAARYLARHKLNWKQIRSLLFQDPLGRGAFQIVPQLYEVCAWFASLDSSFFDNAVLLDPEFLMLSDANVTTDLQRKMLTEQLLVRLANGELLDRWETFNYINYRKLNNLDIANQLKFYITDVTKGVVVRRAAIDIASACSVESLDEVFVSIALNDKEKLVIRARAIKAIAEIGSESAKEALRPLVDSGFREDPEDELKGVTLQALWPGHIATDKLFSLLTPPKRHSFLGAYYSFTDKYLVGEISAKDIVIALDWVKENAVHERSIEYYLRKLADAIMLKAFDSFTIPGVEERFSQIVYERLKKFEEVIGGHAVDDEIVSSFQKSLEDENDKRRQLIKSVVNLLISENTTGKRRGYFLWSHGKVKIVFSKDLPWLIQWLGQEKNEEIQQILAEVIQRVFNIKSSNDIELLIQARNKNRFLERETTYWFEPLRLDSQAAKDQKKQWRQEQEWAKKREKDEKMEILKIVSPSKIKEHLVKSERGDADSWWLLNNALCMYQHELSEEDIREMPGWKVLDADTQERIIKVGKSFILQQESKPDIWLGKNKIYFPAMSGYRALKIYFEREKSFVESLGKEVWKKWAPIIIGMPFISNDPKNGELITLAYKNAPDEIISTLDVLIDEDEQKHGSLFMLSLLDGCVDEKMVIFLLNKAKKPKFRSSAVGDILQFLLKHKVQLAKDYVKSLIQVPLSEDKDERELSLIAAVSLLWHAEQVDWIYLWKLIQNDREFGRSLIERAHDNPLRGSGMLPKLTEVQLSELYLWLMKDFPPEKYFQPEGGGTVTPEISIGEWRDSVLRVLMDKGTVEACRQIERIASALPQHSWIKEFTLIQARRITLEKSWQSLSVGQILKLVENQELRLINTPDELLDIVIDSLEALGIKLQKGEQPQVIDLWNEKRVTEVISGKRNIYFLSSPKDEGRLSDKIKTHLQESLVNRGVVVNREVEIKRGSETDIHISSFSRDDLERPKDLMKVIIEVKGCWNAELETAMEKQLVDRYLTEADCSRGVYLIGWFVCDRWNDPSDGRLKKSPKSDIMTTKEKYKLQAVELSKKESLRVESIVLDCRL